jgi:hypothetical protein
MQLQRFAQELRQAGRRARPTAGVWRRAHLRIAP